MQHKKSEVEVACGICPGLALATGSRANLDQIPDCLLHAGTIAQGQSDRALHVAHTPCWLPVPHVVQAPEQG